MSVDVVTASEFESWVQPHLPDLRRFADTLAASRDDADELVQETLINAWRKWSTYDPARGSPRVWLFGIAASQKRQAFRRRRPTLGWNADEMVAGPTGVDVDLRRAVQKLPRRQRELVILRYYLSLPLTDIAQITTAPREPSNQVCQTHVETSPPR